MRNARAILITAALSMLPVAAYSQGKPAPADAFLYIIWPPDGATLKGAFWCRFGLRNMGVTQAGSNAPNLLLIGLAPVVLGLLWILFHRTHWGAKNEVTRASPRQSMVICRSHITGCSGTDRSNGMCTPLLHWPRAPTCSTRHSRKRGTPRSRWFPDSPPRSGNS
jgi:hypothetical protein